MSNILNLMRDTALYLLQTLQHNGVILVLGILIAGALRVYVDAERMKRWLLNRPALSIPATVAFGAFTPFCACGTMAVVLGMLASSLPWGAVMAFLTSSPLMSPDEFVMISGILGLRFALALTISSVLIGVGAGYAANTLQNKTAFFADQLRFSDTKKRPATRKGTATNAALRSARFIPSASYSGSASASCCVGTQAGTCCIKAEPIKPASLVAALFRRLKLDELAETIFEIGIKKILPLFLAFAAIGFLINRFVPTAWVTAIFGAKNIFYGPDRGNCWASALCKRQRGNSADEFPDASGCLAGRDAGVYDHRPRHQRGRHRGSIVDPETPRNCVLYSLSHDWRNHIGLRLRRGSTAVLTQGIRFFALLFLRYLKERHR